MTEVVTNPAAPKVEIPKGTSTSSDPIEGGVVVINAAVPPGEDGHVIHRTLSTKELSDRDEAQSLAVGWSRRRALGYLRMTRNALLGATDFVELPSVGKSLDAGAATAWATWRQALRDLPETIADPDDPTWPTPPAAVSGLAPWAQLWPALDFSAFE